MVRRTPRSTRTYTLFPDTALFRYVLRCPPGPGQSVGAKVAIAWNGSGEAARAMTAARPVLRKADAVTILASADRELPISGVDAGRYLESHGVSCKIGRAHV